MDELKLEVGAIAEFVTTAGISFIGKFKKEDDKTVYFEDVLCITLAPMQNPEGDGYVQAPKFDILNYFSSGKNWEMKKSNIIYISSEIGPNFVNIYEAYVNQFNESKKRGGSDIDVVQDIPSELK